MQMILHGATGRMGAAVRRLVENDPQHHWTIAACVSPDYPAIDGLCYPSLSDYQGAADCIIDFSNHAATADLTAYAVARHLPVVIATTGHTDEELAMIQDASKVIPVFHSANMSLGVAVLVKLAKEAVRMFPNADIEIIEKHHNQKMDAPSGTALMLADAICEVRPESQKVLGRAGYGKRQKQDIGIHAIRIGNEVGTHEILIGTGSETLTLTHQANDRSLFADGALSAATFLVTCAPGMYDMRDVLA